jgi:hypothetical protein
MPSHQERRHQRYTCPICKTTTLDEYATHNVRDEDGAGPYCLVRKHGLWYRCAKITSIDYTPEPVS